MTSNDGFRFGAKYTSPIAVNGVTIVAAVEPTYCNPGGEPEVRSSISSTAICSLRSATRTVRSLSAGGATAIRYRYISLTARRLF